MAKNKPSIPKGTRDFSPVEMSRRNFIFNTIKRNFALFGFRQIETPAMENLSTLMGKYGEEGDKLLFKILNSGNFMEGVDPELAASGQSLKIAAAIAEKGLRYDLTVPFARYVTQHRAEIDFPFKRYQIQPVWRADRPQKGRYREFYQCDADIIGSTSLNNEVELLQLLDATFEALGVNIAVKLNNRKVLAGIAEVIGQSDKLLDITVAIDKIDKIGSEAVNAELAERGLTPLSIERLQPFLKIDGPNHARLEQLEEALRGSETGMAGIKELRHVIDTFNAIGHKAALELDVSLARGLNYYTGCIIEVKALDHAIGSIAGGGRYDNLTGIFGLPDVSGVGVSFGADRIYDVMTALDLFPPGGDAPVTVMFANFGQREATAALKAVSLLRQNGISSQLYPDQTKMKNQLSHASKMNIPFVAMIGTDELHNNTITIKNMETGVQETVGAELLVDYFKK